MLCYNCFKENKNEGKPCPFCGYDASADEGKYPKSLKHGSILNGKYIIGRVLGQGGFGITYVAQDYQTKERVAIKEYLPEDTALRGRGEHMVSSYTGDNSDRFVYGKQQFLAEAETMASFMGSENIVNVIKFFEENGTAYLVMEYIDGTGLNDYVKEHGGKLTIKEADKLLLPVMDALKWVHSKGIIHRDIAPDNIIITKKGIAKLIDFGAARYSTGEKSKSLDVILKHGFAPKEQYTRHGKQGPYTDVYALAATYYYAITGKTPPDSVARIDEDDLMLPSTLGVEISPEAEDALMKALEVDCSERYQTMDEFETDLEKANGGSVVTEEKKPSNQKKMAIAAATLSVVAIVTCVAVFTGKKEKLPDKTVIIEATPEPTPEATPEPEKGTFAYKIMLAENGDAQMQYEVGKAYLDGTEEVNKDTVKGAKYIKLAAENGVAQAYTELGNRAWSADSYSTGAATIAYNYYTKAIELDEDNYEACNGIGQMLYNAKKAEEYGYWTADFYLETDDYKMYEYLKKASDGGISDADYTLYCLYNQDKDNKKEAFNHLMKAVMAKNYDATVAMLDRNYTNSEWKKFNADCMPEISRIEMREICLNNLTEWAEAGDAEAMVELGRYYTYHDKNSTLATSWYRKAFDADMEAAKNGDTHKAYLIAEAYCGQDWRYKNVVEKDLDEARKWLEMANSQGGSYTLEELE